DTVGADPLRDGHVVVKAEGFTIAWARAARSEADFTFRVRRGGAPLEGRILDLEGRPVAGLRVRVLSVAAPARGDLSDFLKALEGREALYGAFKHLPRRLENRFSGRDVSALLPSATTDAAGRFRLSGFDREQLVHLHIEGPRIETQRV